jgi:hypothetical protein
VDLVGLRIEALKQTPNEVRLVMECGLSAHLDDPIYYAVWVRRGSVTARMLVEVKGLTPTAVAETWMDLHTEIVPHAVVQGGIA